MKLRLPDAPLVEVVFEVHWETVPIPGIELVSPDPGFNFFSKAFAEAAKKSGFVVCEDQGSSNPPSPGGIVYRYKEGSGAPFPILQIGHGILACNIGTDYDWGSFRKLIALGSDTLLASYPRNAFFPLHFSKLELRYIDAFDVSLVGHSDIERFLQHDTQLNYEPLEFLGTEGFSNNKSGLFRLKKQLSSDKDSWFHIEIGNGVSEGEDAIVMTTRVIKSRKKLDLGNRKQTIKKNILNWSDLAHNVTSPFFRKFVGKDLMEVFSNKSKNKSSKKVRKAN